MLHKEIYKRKVLSPTQSLFTADRKNNAFNPIESPLRPIKQFHALTRWLVMPIYWKDVSFRQKKLGITIPWSVESPKATHESEDETAPSISKLTLCPLLSFFHVNKYLQVPVWHPSGCLQHVLVFPQVLVSTFVYKDNAHKHLLSAENKKLGTQLDLQITKLRLHWVLDR